MFEFLIIYVAVVASACGDDLDVHQAALISSVLSTNERLKITLICCLSKSFVSFVQLARCSIEEIHIDSGAVKTFPFVPFL